MGNLKISYGWNWITSRIALGGGFEQFQDAADLQKAGITHVINCTEKPDPNYATIPILITCWPKPPQPDDGNPRGAAWFKEGAEFWRANESSKIYVHCHGGLNRSASMVYYILRLMGLGPIDARLVIVSNRPMDAIGIRYSQEADSLIL